MAVPSYVCATSATPLAGVLWSKGLSSGAVLAGLLANVRQQAVHLLDKLQDADRHRREVERHERLQRRGG